GCTGALARARPVSAGSAPAIEVWGWVSAETASTGPAFVAIADGAGAVRGLADFAAAAPRAQPGRVGWSGFVADYDPGAPPRAWLVPPAGRTACRGEGEADGTAARRRRAQPRPVGLPSRAAMSGALRRPFEAVDYTALMRAYPPPPEYFETEWYRDPE